MATTRYTAARIWDGSGAMIRTGSSTSPAASSPPSALLSRSRRTGRTLPSATSAT